MVEEDKLEEFIKQYKADRQADLQRATQNNHNNLSALCFSFAVAMVGLATANISLASTIVSGIACLIFIILGGLERSRAVGVTNAHE